MILVLINYKSIQCEVFFFRHHPFLLASHAENTFSAYLASTGFWIDEKPFHFETSSVLDIVVGIRKQANWEWFIADEIGSLYAWYNRVM